MKESGPTEGRCSTGDTTLDQMLNGGFPVGRAVLVTGTPGTGKSTMAMQFLQAGLDAGEECLYISTEQTLDELRHAFDSFVFDLDHDNLTVTSMHARTGRTIENDEPELVIERFEGGEIIGEGFSAAFSSERITQVLERYHSADRVVLDSVTGLEPMAETQTVYRRGVLDLIQLFTNEFDATTLLTAEYVGAEPVTSQVETVTASNTVQYNAYGVLRLWRERKRGDLRRFIDVMKMRGVDHDTRQHELAFSENGLTVTPRRRGLPAEQVRTDTLSTGLDGLDTLLGGGLPKGETTLLEHDGEANITNFIFQWGTAALNEGMSLVLVPRVNTSPERVSELIDQKTAYGDTVEALDADRLFVIDVLGAWDHHENVYNPRLEDAGLRYLFEKIRDDHAGEGLFMLLNTDAKVHSLGAEAVRRFRYWVPSQYLTDDDVMVDIHNPALMSQGIAEFYIDAASTAIESWMDESGLQYLRLKKGQTGELGSVRLLEYLEEEPYISVR